MIYDDNYLFKKSGSGVLDITSTGDTDVIELMGAFKDWQGHMIEGSDKPNALGALRLYITITEPLSAGGSVPLTISAGDQKSGPFEAVYNYKLTEKSQRFFSVELPRFAGRFLKLSAGEATGEPSTGKITVYLKAAGGV